MATFSYDVRERLTGVSRTGSSASYLVNPLGQRIQKTVTPASGPAHHTVFTFDDAGHLVAEAHSDGGGNEYIWLGDIPVAMNKLPAPGTFGSVVVEATSASFDSTWWFGDSAAGRYSSAAYWANGFAGDPQGGITVNDDYGSNTAPNAFSFLAGSWCCSGQGVIGEGRFTHGSPQAGGTAAVQWTADLPSAGSYAVYASHPTDYWATDAAHFTVNHAGGSSAATVSQQGMAGWSLLGTYSFSAGLATVTLTDESPTNMNVYADAVKFVPTPVSFGYHALTWTPSLAGSGLHTVYAWWPTQFPSHTQARYRITTATGTTEVTVDQTQDKAQWVRLGMFNLNSSSAKVELLDAGPGTVRIYADAVKFEPAMTYYVHTDHLNTPRQLTTSDANNTVVWRWAGEPFGSTPASSDPDGDGQAVVFNLRFPGQYFDAETGLHYNYFRDYDPNIGRYVQSDPIGLGGGLNTYGYVRQAPTMLVDPFGLRNHCMPVDCDTGVDVGGAGPLVVPLIPVGQAVPVPALSSGDAATDQGWVSPVDDTGPDSATRPSELVVPRQCRPEKDDFCYRRWMREDASCGLWSFFGGRWVQACKARAAIRRNLCIANGGRPSFYEPRPWGPQDYPW